MECPFSQIFRQVRELERQVQWHWSNGMRSQQHLKGPPPNEICRLFIEQLFIFMEYA